MNIEMRIWKYPDSWSSMVFIKRNAVSIQTFYLDFTHKRHFNCKYSFSV